MNGHGGGSVPPAVLATTPTMRMADILNDESMEGDESDVMFVGAANPETLHNDNANAEMDPPWRKNNSHPTTVNMRSGARISNGDVSIAAGGGFRGVGWPTSVLRLNVIDSGAGTTGGRQQQHQPLTSGQRIQQIMTTKKPAAKRERAAPSRGPPQQKQLPAPAARTKTASHAAAATKNDGCRVIKKIGANNMWTDAEKALFEEGFRLYGPNYIKIAEHLGTRPHKSVSSYAQRWRKQNDVAGLAPTLSTSGGGGGDLQQSGTHENDHGTQPTIPETHDNALAGEPVDVPPTAARVLDLSSKETSQRPRRGARQQETIDAAAQVVNEVIEINTEESSTETPQKAPQRVGTRPPRAQQRSAAKNNDQVVVAQPQRKKPKLSLAMASKPEHDAPLVSPSSSSVASSVSKPTKRGKKRPQHEFDGITDSPTSYLPFSASSSTDDDRKCEFCKLARGVCVTLHCTQCKRVYHTKCLVKHFKPFCQLASDEPIETQLEKLHLSAPSQVKAKMLRCAPCHAALLDNIRRDGCAWDCDCLSCQNPGRIVNYRREMVIQFLVHHVDEKPSKQKSKASKAKVDATGGAKKPAAAAPTRAGTRRTRHHSVVPGSENESVKMDLEASMEVVSPAPAAVDVIPAAGGKKQPRTSKKKAVSNGSAADKRAKAKTKELIEPEANDTGCGDKNGSSENCDDESNRENDGKQDDDVQMDNAEDDVAVAEPDQEREAAKSSRSLSKLSPVVTGAADSEPELTGKELLAAVRVNVNGNYETFRIVCTETPSLTASGVMKEGLYVLHSDHARDRVECVCCDKRMSREQFVYHTDSTFLLVANKTPWDFLFACHYDGTASPLRRFLELLDTRSTTVRGVVGGVLKQIKKKNLKSPKSPAVEGVIADAAISVEDGYAPVGSLVASLSDAVSQLGSMFIARRAPGSADSRASSSKPAYMIRLVCVSREMTIPMPDGTVQNTLDRSTGGYPHKDGWLYFDKGTAGPSYTHVLCDCCSREMDLGDFILHTSIGQWDLKYKRRHVYVPQRDNQRVLLDLEHVWQAILTLHQRHLLDAFMTSLPGLAMRF